MVESYNNYSAHQVMMKLGYLPFAL